MKIQRLLLAAFAAAPSFAPASGEPATELDPVVVTATRSEIRLSETLASVTVITRQDIERAQAGDIAELLRFHAGVELGRNGGPGQATSVFVRGGESDHTLVLVDGVRINPSTFGGAAVQNIHPDLIERIEIVKGPRASLYGSEAIAGVINIVTRQADAARVDASVRTGSYGTYELGGFAGGADESVRLSLQGRHLQTDGFSPIESQSGERGYRQNSVNLQVAAGAGAVEVGARLWHAGGEVEYYAFNPVTFMLDLPAEQSYRNQVVAAHLTARPQKDWSSTLTASRMEDDIRQQQGTDFARTVRAEADWQNRLRLTPSHAFAAGVTVAREDVEAESFGLPVTEQRNLYSLRGQYELSLKSHRALLAVGHADHDAFGDITTWNAEYGYELATGTHLIGAAGTGFRAPSALDRFGPSGNTNLRPERSRSYELGARQRIGRHQTVDLRLFRTEVRDLINFPPPAFMAENVDEYRNEGIELGYRLQAGAWSARLAGLRQDPVDHRTGEPLLRRARRSATASLAWNRTDHDLGVDVLASGPRTDVDFNTFSRIKAPGYALLNLTGGTSLGYGWRLQGRVENLLDKAYQTADGYRQPERSYFVTLGAAW
jgi:vitamin B12 transporter